MKPSFSFRRAACALLAIVVASIVAFAYVSWRGAPENGDAKPRSSSGRTVRTAEGIATKNAAASTKRENVAVSMDVRVLDAEGNPVDAVVQVYSESDLEPWNRSHASSPHGSAFACGCQESLRSVAAMAAEGFRPPTPAFSGSSHASDGGIVHLEGKASLPAAFLAMSDDGSKAGFLTGWRAGGANGDASDDGEEAILVVHPVETVRGVVLDSKGRPVPGAAVVAYSVLTPIIAASVTGEDGRFGIHPIPLGGARIAVHADGYVPQTVPDIVGGGRGQDAPLVVRLWKSGRLLGRTLDAKGRPVPGASVQLHSALRTAGEDSLLDVAESGDGGEFALDSPGRGRFVVSAFKGRMWAVADVPEDTDGSPEETDRAGAGGRTVDLVLRNGAFVSGRVYDASSGDGVPGAAIAVTMDDRTIFRTRSGHGGEFDQESVPPFAWVSVSAPGFVGQKRILPEMGDAKSVRMEFGLERALAVSGRILPPPGESGLPPGLVVSMEQGGKRQTVQLDGNGSFAFEAVGGGVAELESHHSSAGRAHALVTPPATGLEIPLVRGASISVRMVDESTSAPLSSGTLIAARGSPGDRDSMSSTFLTDVPPGSDGTLVLSGLFPGVYDAVVRSPGYMERRVRDVRLVGEDEFADLGVIRLSKGKTVAGIVVDASGRPVPDADVKVIAQSQEGDSSGLELFTATTGPEGEFSISGMAEPTIAFAFHDVLGESDEVQVPDSKDGTSRIELVLKGTDESREGAVVEGRVEGESGESVPSFSINGQLYSSSPEGAFSLTAPCDRNSPDVFFIEVEAPGYASEERKVDLICGGTVQVGTVRLGRGRSISGTVRSHDGAPVGNALVTAEAACTKLSLFEISSASNGDGSYEIHGIPKDCDGVLVHAKAASRSSGKVRVQFPEGIGSRDGIQLELSAEGAVFGRVTDAWGNPVSGAAVSFSAADEATGFGNGDAGQERHSISDGQGNYVLAACPVGAAVVTCEYQLPDGRSFMDNRSVSISREGERVRVDFEAPSDAGNLDVVTLIPDARFAVLVPGALVSELAPEAGEVDGSKGVMIQSAQFFGGVARFEGVSAGVFLVLVRSNASGDALGTAVARIPRGGSASVMVEPDIEGEETSDGQDGDG